MLRRYYPSQYVESVFAIDYDKLYRLGYRAVLFDIDNTLVHHGTDSTPEVDELFREVHRAGLKTLLLSNNSAERIERFLRNIDSPYIEEAGKPHPANYLRGAALLGVRPEQAIYIGDQIFTDIVGANRAGMDSILVRYLRYDGETKIGIRRNLEKAVLFCYRRSRRRDRLGDILKEKKG